MKKIACVLVILAAASTGAVAKDLKQDNKTALAATKMTDAEMDRVTAGFSFFNGRGREITNPGIGHHFGIAKGGGARPL